MPWQIFPSEDGDAFRLDSRKARALRAKLAITMASHKDYGYDRDALYKESGRRRSFVIENTRALTEIDYSTLFDVESNNNTNPFSLSSAQCRVTPSAMPATPLGAARALSPTRPGAPAKATVSLQKMYTQNDRRRMWTIYDRWRLLPDAEPCRRRIHLQSGEPR